MALFIRQSEDDRSKLQERLAAELRAKAKAKADVDNERPDGVTDSAYLKDTKQTTSLAWLWVIVAIFAIITIGLLIIKANN